jgi:hypothetical protein
MEKRNVAEKGRTVCVFCGRPASTFVGEKAVCKIHTKLVKESAKEQPLKDAAPSLTRNW